MKLTPEQQKERDAILADMEAMRLRVNALFTPKVQPTWPQCGDDYLYIDSTFSIAFATWNGSMLGNARLAIGNVIHPSKQAELERHIEALKVHHELRSMHGRTAPPDGEVCITWYILRENGGRFASGSDNRQHLATVALGGVWFSSKESCDIAIRAIGQERLAVLYDDFLQTPMGDK